jgi:GntR family transcriptional regulator/MocR family aminotransferase
MKRTGSAITPLLAVDRDSREPIHRQIYESFRFAILNGNLHPGQRVPSTRALSSELQISRMPLLTAFAQLLAEGYFESRIGRGTVISASLPERLSPAPTTYANKARVATGPRRVAERCTSLPDTFRPTWIRGSGAFSMGEIALDEFPRRIWSNLQVRAARNGRAIASYGDSHGLWEPREAIAEYLRTTRAVSCDATQVLIVSGSQHGVELATRVLLDPGSTVWVEDPGYKLTRDVLALADARIVPVPVDEEGLNVQAGMKLCRNARAAFVTPSHQYPLGMTMSLPRRLQLLRWAERTGAWLVEDDYDSEFRYDSMPIPSLQGLDANGRVIYIGTFSKVLFPALRLGYLVLPADLVEPFGKMRRASDLGSATLNQVVLNEFIREGHFARHIRRMRTLYRERRGALVEALARELPDFEIHGAEAGLHLTVFLHDKMSDVERSMDAARQKLWLWPLSSSYSGRPLKSGFILGFASTPAKEMRSAVQKLRNLLRSRT